MRKLERTDKILLGILGFLLLGGLSGAIPMLIKPDGSLIGLTTSMLKHAPVDDYFWPGIFLLLTMCLWPAITVYAILVRKAWAYVSAILLGILTVGWIIYETFTLQIFSPLQPTILLVGVGLIYFGREKQSQ